MRICLLFYPVNTKDCPIRNQTASLPQRITPLSKRRCFFPIQNPNSPCPTAQCRQVVKTKLYHKIHTI
ncbi:hypothetical protein NMH_1639 [Neisseria meningitidis H44/76]|uniref:Uncharacterized protein n=1 Tax=Neisseria meningitidis serogroup B / serotype 15 (strain H44/76) TaxID=909420 RepID=E6MY92_NEIMH|nr:hypothetical protein NMH_1639 [Neisseria meningitidis H44/76]